MSDQDVRSRLKHFIPRRGRNAMTVVFGPSATETALTLDRAAREQQVLILFVHDGVARFRLPSDSRLFAGSVDVPDRLRHIAADMFEYFGIEEGFQLNTVCLKGGEPIRERGVPLLLALLSDLKFHRRADLMLLRCLLRNLPGIGREVRSCLPAAPPDGAVLICGAGPSLGGQLETIRRYRNRFQLFCVGHAYPRLHAAGVRPDLVVEIDAESSLRNRPLPTPAICPLAATPQTAPAVVEAFTEHLWLADPDPVRDRWLRQLGINLPSVTVARSVIVTAVDLAVRSGYRQIALVGSDLCLGENDVFYDSVEGKSSAVAERCPLPGNDAPEVVSTPALSGIRDALQQYLQACPVKVHNCTSGGAVIAGTVRSSLDTWSADHMAAAPTMLPPPVAVAGLETRLAGMFDRENETPPVVASALARWLDTVKREAQPGIDLTSLPLQLRRDLADDLAGKAGTGPYDYNAFREFAVAVIRRNYPAYADWLARSEEGMEPDDFTVASWLTSLPQVSRRSTGTALTSGDNREHAAHETVSRFTVDRQFDSARDAVVIAGPGDWQPAVELLRCYPDTPVMVLDPHPRLFRRLINYSLFLHVFPADSLIAGTGIPELPDWRREAQRRLRDWKRAGRRILRFTHPALTEDSEVMALIEFVGA